MISNHLVPEEEIDEYLTYQSARQCALQLRYDTWSDSSGYTEEAGIQDFYEFVRQRDRLSAWTMTDDHLTLSLGILPEDAANKRWKSIGDEWQDVMADFKSVVRENGRETWLDELAKLCQRRFDQDYRGLGVCGFYRIRLRSLKQHTHQIRRRIEADLFSDWKNGVRSLADTSILLAALLDFINDRQNAFDAQMTKTRDNQTDAADRVRANSQSWVRMTVFQKLTGKPESLFSEQSQALLEQYIYRTKIEGVLFAKRILTDLVIRISSLKSEVDCISATIEEAIKNYGVRISERLCDDSVAGQLRGPLVCDCKPNLVRDIARNRVKNENEQHSQATRVRLAIIQRLGDRPDFSIFNQRVGVSELMDVLDSQSGANRRTELMKAIDAEVSGVELQKAAM